MSATRGSRKKLPRTPQPLHLPRQRRACLSSDPSSAALPGASRLNASSLPTPPSAAADASTSSLAFPVADTRRSVGSDVYKRVSFADDHDQDLRHSTGSDDGSGGLPPVLGEGCQRGGVQETPSMTDSTNTLELRACISAVSKPRSSVARSLAVGLNTVKEDGSSSGPSNSLLQPLPPPMELPPSAPFTGESRDAEGMQLPQKKAEPNNHQKFCKHRLWCLATVVRMAIVVGGCVLLAIADFAPCRRAIVEGSLFRGWHDSRHEQFLEAAARATNSLRRTHSSEPDMVDQTCSQHEDFEWRTVEFLYYEREPGAGILPDMVQEFEEKVRKLDGWQRFCNDVPEMWRRLCQSGDSVAALYFGERSEVRDSATGVNQEFKFTGELGEKIGLSPDRLHSFMRSLTGDDSTFKRWFARGYKPGDHIKALRSGFMFCLPGHVARTEWSDFVNNELEPVLIADDDVETNAGGAFRSLFRYPESKSFLVFACADDMVRQELTRALFREARPFVVLFVLAGFVVFATTWHPLLGLTSAGLAASNSLMITYLERLHGHCFLRGFQAIPILTFAAWSFAALSTVEVAVATVSCWEKRRWRSMPWWIKHRSREWLTGIQEEREAENVAEGAAGTQGPEGGQSDEEGDAYTWLQHLQIQRVRDSTMDWLHTQQAVNKAVSNKGVDEEIVPIGLVSTMISVARRTIRPYVPLCVEGCAFHFEVCAPTFVRAAALYLMALSFQETPIVMEFLLPAAWACFFPLVSGSLLCPPIVQVEEALWRVCHPRLQRWRGRSGLHGTTAIKTRSSLGTLLCKPRWRHKVAKVILTWAGHRHVPRGLMIFALLLILAICSTRHVRRPVTAEVPLWPRDHRLTKEKEARDAFLHTAFLAESIAGMVPAHGRECQPWAPDAQHCSWYDCLDERVDIEPGTCACYYQHDEMPASFLCNASTRMWTAPGAAVQAPVVAHWHWVEERLGIPLAGGMASGNATVVGVHEGAFLDLLVWSSGEVFTGQTTSGGLTTRAEADTLDEYLYRDSVLFEEACVRILCYCGLPPCRMHDPVPWTYLGAAPMAWNMTQSARIDPEPMNATGIVYAVWGLVEFPTEAATTALMRFSTSFHLESPWAQRAILSFCEGLDPGLQVLSSDCWLVDFRDWVELGGKLFPLASGFYDELGRFLTEQRDISANDEDEGPLFWSAAGTVVGLYASFHVELPGESEREAYQSSWETYVRHRNDMASDEGSGRVWATSEVFVSAVEPSEQELKDTVEGAHSRLLTVMLIAMPAMVGVLTCSPCTAGTFLLCLSVVTLSIEICFRLLHSAANISHILAIAALFAGLTTPAATISLRYGLSSAWPAGRRRSTHLEELDRGSSTESLDAFMKSSASAQDMALLTKQAVLEEERRDRLTEALLRGADCVAAHVFCAGIAGISLLALDLAPFQDIGAAFLVLAILSPLASLVLLPALFVLGLGPSVVRLNLFMDVFSKNTPRAVAAARLLGWPCTLFARRFEARQCSKQAQEPAEEPEPAARVGSVRKKLSKQESCQLTLSSLHVVGAGAGPPFHAVSTTYEAIRPTG